MNLGVKDEHNLEEILFEYAFKEESQKSENVRSDADLIEYPIMQVVLEAGLKYDYERWKKDRSSTRVSLEDLMEDTLKYYPDADKQVLGFIFGFCTHAGTGHVQYEMIRSTFRAGYCYYFANMLKLAFNRGMVCWCAPYGHFCWVDENNIPYDIEGVYDNCDTELIPAEMLGDMIKDFFHVPGVIYDAKRSEIEAVMCKWRKQTKLNLKDSLKHESILQTYREHKIQIPIRESA